MKTYILRLEPHDDLVSARDKMGWAKDSRILLVWPEKKSILNRRLDLILLQRHSRLLGSPLALVTRDSEVHYFAPRLGIPVFRTIAKAQGQRWRVPRHFRRLGDTEHRQEKAERAGAEALPEHSDVLYRQPFESSAKLVSPRPESSLTELKPPARLAFFVAGVLALLALAVCLAPSARVTLTPRTLVQDVLINAWSSPEIERVNIGGATPSRLVAVSVEGRDRLPASGAVRLPSQPAAGVVTFTNLTDQLVEIPKGSGVRGLSTENAGIRFITTQAGQAPAGSGQTVDLPVQCAMPGPRGNLPAGALSAIEGMLGLQLSAVNPSPTRGGADQLLPIPTRADRLKLADQLRLALEKTALLEIQQQLNPGDLLIPGSLQLISTVDETYKPAENLPGDQLSLSQRLEFQARVVEASALQNLAQMVFDANLPTGYQAQEDTLQLEILTQPEIDASGVIRWRIHAVRRVAAQISASEAVQIALGLDPCQAVQRLTVRLPLEQPPDIELQPAWWPRLPILPFRISVQSQG